MFFFFIFADRRHPHIFVFGCNIFIADQLVVSLDMHVPRLYLEHCASLESLFPFVGRHQPDSICRAAIIQSLLSCVLEHA